MSKKLAVNEISSFRKLLTFGKVKSGRQSITNETVQKIQSFYLRDDVSYQQPGKRDTISVRDKISGQKSTKQKRILLTTIK